MFNSCCNNIIVSYSFIFMCWINLIVQVLLNVTLNVIRCLFLHHNLHMLYDGGRKEKSMDVIIITLAVYTDQNVDANQLLHIIQRPAIWDSQVFSEITRCQCHALVCTIVNYGSYIAHIYYAALVRHWTAHCQKGNPKKLLDVRHVFQSSNLSHSNDWLKI